MTTQVNNNATACFYPNGQTNGVTRGNWQDPAFVPCDPSARHSACCAVGESCTENGLCYSNSGGIYRGACTDSKWQDGACAKVCVSATAGPNLGIQDNYDFLQDCGTIGVGRAWTCQSNSCSNSSQVFPLAIGFIRQTNISGLLANNTSGPGTCSSIHAGSATGSSTPSNTPSHQGCETGRSPVALGAGLGAGLGVAFLTAIAWALFERKKRKAFLAQVNKPTEASAQPGSRDDPKFSTNEDSQIRSELHGIGTTQELPSDRTRVEVA